MDNFFRLCIAIFSFAALNFANALGVNTGKTTTMGSLRGGTLGTASNISYQTGRHGLHTYYTQHLQSYGGKMYQLPARAKTPTPGLIKGLRNLLKSPVGKANIGLIVGAWALDGIIEELGIIEEDGDYSIPVSPVDDPAGFGYKGSWRTNECGNGAQGTLGDVLSHLSKSSCAGSGHLVYHGKCQNYYDLKCDEYKFVTDEYPQGLTVWHRQKMSCMEYFKDPVKCQVTGKRPLTDADIDTINFRDWTPPANVPKSAVEQVYPYISPADTTIELDPITVTAPAETVTAPDGSVKQTTTTETVSVSSPNTDPALQVSVKTTTNTYQDGLLTDTQTTTTTTDATAATPTESAPAEQITDCELVPTLCATQKEQLERDKARDEWLKEMPDEIVPPLPPIIDNPIELQPFEINLGSKTCPSPKKINLSFTSVVLPLDIICEYAKNLRIFILMAAFILAARIVINGVK